MESRDLMTSCTLDLNIIFITLSAWYGYKNVQGVTKTN